VRSGRKNCAGGKREKQGGIEGKERPERNGQKGGEKKRGTEGPTGIRKERRGVKKSRGPIFRRRNIKGQILVVQNIGEEKYYIQGKDRHKTPPPRGRKGNSREKTAKLLTYIFLIARVRGKANPWEGI